MKFQSTVDANIHVLCRSRGLLSLDLPWLGTLDVTRDDNSARGLPFFEQRRDGAATETWVGRFYVLFHRDDGIRPSTPTKLAIAAMAFAVAGWTEGHLWHLPFLG